MHIYLKEVNESSVSFCGGQRRKAGDQEKIGYVLQPQSVILEPPLSLNRAIYHLSVNVAQKEKTSLCNEKSESWSDKLRGELCAEFIQTPTIIQGEEINDITEISH